MCIYCILYVILYIIYMDAYMFIYTNIIIYLLCKNYYYSFSECTLRNYSIWVSISPVPRTYFDDTIDHSVNP